MSYHSKVIDNKVIVNRLNAAKSTVDGLTSTLHVCSDFDNTIVSENTAILLIKYYLFHSKHELFHKRLWRVMHLFPKGRRQHNLLVYYSLLEMLSQEERERVVLSAQFNPRWLRAIKTLRMQRKTRHVDVKIISRNAADIVILWIDTHKNELAMLGVKVSCVVANKPVSDRIVEVVKESSGLEHFDHVRFGLMDEPGKKRFLDKHMIYIGDAEEEGLRGLVKEFILV